MYSNSLLTVHSPHIQGNTTHVSSINHVFKQPVFRQRQH